MPRTSPGSYQALIQYQQWNGIDNLTADDVRVPAGFVRTADNVDIDSTKMLHTRTGVFQLLQSGESHSLWSDGTLCFGTLDGDLIQINSVTRSPTDGTWSISYTVLLVDIGKSRVNFIPVGDKVFFSNHSKSGYIENSVAHSFLTIDAGELSNSFKVRMVGGGLLEFFNSRLYSAQDDIIFFSDAASPMIMDTRSNFLVPGGIITMMAGVQDGIYISHGSRITFLHYQGEKKYGDADLATPDFIFTPMLDVPAIRGSATSLEKITLGGKYPMGYSGAIGKAAIFATSIGIFLGLPGGKLYDCTSNHYGISGIEEGSATIRWRNGYKQYIFMGEKPAEIGIGTGSFTLPSITLSGIGEES